MKPLAIGDWLRLHPSPFPWGQGGKVESSRLLIMASGGWSPFWNYTGAPSLQSSPWRTKDTHFTERERERVCVCACTLHAQWLSHVRGFATPCTIAHQVLLSMGFLRQEYWSDCHFLEYWSGYYVLLQGIFLTQGLNPCLLCLLHGRQILYH